ncbi:MAG TPA: PEP-CTERM sorting domain-containing protein [Chitinispirillaceae bacterium]|nr:PEP-CTERM sorting domain-containing protein [Chitinispirillaceae bacterium]
MIRSRFTRACCLFSLCYVMAEATPIAMSQISFNMSNITVNLGFGTGCLLSTSTYSNVLADYNGIDVITDELTDEGTVTATVSGATASAAVHSGSIANSTHSTISNGAAVASSAVTSDIYLDVENVDFVSVTMDISTMLDVSVDDPGYEFAYGALVNWLGLSYFDGVDYELVNDDMYSLLFDTDIDGLENSSNKTATLTVSYNFGSNYSGQLMIENIATTFSETQSHPANVPEPSGITLMVMGLAMLLPLAVRRKV